MPARISANRRTATGKANMKPIRNVRKIREQLGLNQSEFWSKVGVTQSGGSRYENGRHIPRPVRGLLRVVYPL